MQDVEFLALLVHREFLTRAQAGELMEPLEGGTSLDALLESEVGWSPERIAQLRRTRAGETPEIPGFDILELLGVGGTARVFHARDKKSRRSVALKVLERRCALVEATRKAFIQEARLLEKLSHPGLVKGLGVARSGNTFFNRLEFLDGSTVLELLDTGHEFDEERALHITLEVAEALRYLEGEGVVHRDVKPGNMMITEKGRVVLIDLGFAAEGGPQTCAEDSAVGTTHYLSPEQARGGAEADVRSDIYSLGISLFQITVGRLPFDGSDDSEVLRKHVMESLSSRELKGRTISAHVQYFIEKMLAKDVDDRYQGWSELIADISAQLKGRDALDFSQDAPDARRKR